MLIGERRQYIVALAQKNGRVLFEELSHTLGISQITIRKDLDVLQSRGALQRTHGGALLPGSGALSDPSLQEKEGRHSSEKQRISAAGVNLVLEGQCVLLDSGTTTTAIARALKKFSWLTIITNAVNIAAELSNTDFEVLLTGGGAAEELVLAGGAAGGRHAARDARGHSVSWGGWVRSGSGLDDAECDGVARESCDGEGCGDGGGRLRFHQV
jgi:DeoR/GlpR family transcriptional regulator of sugar metabolism